MNRFSVNSSAIRSVGYDGTDMDIEFISDSVYRFHGVPAKVYHDFINTPSLGVAFSSMIRKNYFSSRMD